MAMGRVKFYNMDKGFGFIIPDEGGDDVFVHATALKKSGLSLLERDQKIIYELKYYQGKITACNIGFPSIKNLNMISKNKNMNLLDKSDKVHIIVFLTILDIMSGASALRLVLWIYFFIFMIYMNFYILRILFYLIQALIFSSDTKSIYDAIKFEKVCNFILEVIALIISHSIASFLCFCFLYFIDSLFIKTNLIEILIIIQIFLSLSFAFLLKRNSGEKTS